MARREQGRRLFSPGGLVILAVSILGAVPGVVALATDRNDTLYEGGFGERVQGGGAAMTPDTVVWIASMTKAITATAAMQLVEQGGLHLDRPAREVVLPVPGLPFLSVVPATQDLVGAELQLVEREGREAALRQVLQQFEGEYDFIVVDCPPSLGLLTLNVLAAVQGLIIPIQCEYYGLEGISQLLNTVRLVQQNFNPGLAISGVLLTMYDDRTNLGQLVARDVREFFKEKVFNTIIPRNVKLGEAPSHGMPAALYDAKSRGAAAYAALAKEVLARTAA